MHAILERLQHSATLRSLVTNGETAILMAAGFGVLMFLIERAAGAETRQYRTRWFWQDIAYWVVNGTGIFRLLSATMLLTLLQRAIPTLQSHLIDGWPGWARYAVYWGGYDFLFYWVHRWQHSNRWLWAFHATHHAQEEMSYATTARSHPVEQWCYSVLIFLPLLALGAAPTVWLPLQLTQQFLFVMTHCRLDWRFGPLNKVVVSPTFHSVHHSLKPEHHDRNFSGIFSFWDYLFGTAVDVPHREKVYGLRDVKMPTLWSSLFTPFKMLRKPTRIH